MITIKDIISYSKPHPNMMEGARQTILKDNDVVLSIVGGARGLYGDFEKDFEVAVMNANSHDFVTKYYVTDASDDVLAYQNSEQVEYIANLLFKKGFQVG
jgi:hypothetical protein